MENYGLWSIITTEESQLICAKLFITKKSHLLFFLTSLNRLSKNTFPFHGGNKAGQWLLSMTIMKVHCMLCTGRVGHKKGNMILRWKNKKD